MLTTYFIFLHIPAGQILRYRKHDSPKLNHEMPQSENWIQSWNENNDDQVVCGNILFSVWVWRTHKIFFLETPTHLLIVFNLDKVKLKTTPNQITCHRPYSFYGSLDVGNKPFEVVLRVVIFWNNLIRDLEEFLSGLFLLDKWFSSLWFKNAFLKLVMTKKCFG